MPRTKTATPTPPAPPVPDPDLDDWEDPEDDFDDDDNDDNDEEYPSTTPNLPAAARNSDFDFSSLGFDVAWDDIPETSERGGHAGGPGRPAIPYEDVLQVLTNSPGRSARIALFPGDTDESARAARNRTTAIKKRMNSVAPYEKWTIVPRKTANRDAWGIWACYNGLYTDSEMAEVIAKREERGRKIKEGRRRNRP